MTDKPHHDQIACRQQKLTEMEKSVREYHATCKPSHTTEDCQGVIADTVRMDDASERVTIAGRMMTCRMMGKASFMHLQDRHGSIQVYVQKSQLGEETYQAFKQWDLGDILYVEGRLFFTQKGELSVYADHICCIVKSLRPLPDKYHGLTDQEARYRQRYLDLMVNKDSIDLFKKRSLVITQIRQYLLDADFTEVETPMMHPIPGGAQARPFVTHHHALNMPLYLRIAPELYLKRLIVAGLERVFEINRNFRNEGVSTRHNPEFTMLEFYQAYATYEDLMSMTEELLRQLCQQLHGKQQCSYQGVTLDFAPSFTRLTMREALCHYTDIRDVDDHATLAAMATEHGIEVEASVPSMQLKLFEKLVEKQLQQPTFITQYPKEVSPLAKCNPEQREFTDRFELFIAGKEIANGFNELNDPEDQHQRFLEQVKQHQDGDAEAMHYDKDYIEALQYGMPPTAGEGIGIDRLVMILTDAATIKDVILFPLMRREGGEA